MDYEKIECKINDIKTKVPIEAGVEILIYNILDFALEHKNVSVVDINRIWKNQDSRLTTDGGISDLAILSNDFIWKEPGKGKVYGFVEVKYLEKSLDETEQIKGQMSKYDHFIYTNGICWKYYYKGKEQWELVLARFQHGGYNVSEDDYENLLAALKKIDWKN